MNYGSREEITSKAGKLGTSRGVSPYTESIYCKVPQEYHVFFISDITQFPSECCQQKMIKNISKIFTASALL